MLQVIVDRHIDGEVWHLMNKTLGCFGSDSDTKNMAYNGEPVVSIVKIIY